ncbi:MAG: LuxR C-terminal-related transcriptional regulator, partial [Actinomycetota bacterium]|nr:LuxR C-terminal-related transcriptional regulator [Actinomycetota bacterium]
RLDTETERVLIVDAGSAFAEALVCLLGRAGISADHATFDHAESACHGFRPTVVLVDAGSGADLVVGCVEAARRCQPSVRVLLLHGTGEACADDGSLEAEVDAAAVVTSRTEPARLLKLLRSDGDGLPGDGSQHLPDLPVATAAAQAQRPGGSGEGLLLRHLTSREAEVLRELMAGRRSEDIAGRLGISPNTVRTHVQNVLAKLGAHTRLEACTIARRAGLQPASPGTAQR